MTIQQLPPAYPFEITDPSDSPEGGLNLTQIKATLIRRIPLIAGVALGITSLAAVKIFSSPLLYTSSFEMLAESLQIERQVTDVGTPSSSDAREKIAFIELDDIELRKLSGNELISRVVDSLQAEYPDLEYGDVVKNLTLTLNTNNQDQTKNILQVEYQNSEPEQVEAVINALEKVYLDYSKERRDQGVNKGIEFLNQEIPKVQAEVNRYQENLAQLKQQYGFTDIEIESTQTSGRLSGLREQIIEIETELKALYLKANNLEKESQQEPFTSTTAIDLNLPHYQSLIEQLSALNIEIEQMSAIYQDNHLEIQLLKDRKARLVKLIQQEAATNRQKINNEIAVLETSKENLQAEINNLEQKVNLLPRVSNDYDNIQQQLTIKNNKLSELETQKNALLIDTAQTQSPWQILTPANRPKPNNAIRINYLALSSAFGILSGIGLALFLERYNSKVYNSGQIEKLTGLPILSSIPYDFLYAKNSSIKQLPSRVDPKEDRELEMPQSKLGHYKPSPGFAQLELPSFSIFCSLATNLGLFQPETKIKSILVTSSSIEEGKSTIAINLAKASAVMGKRVLLVDTDLRSSDRLTQRLGLDNDFGLRNLLTGNSFKPEQDFIQKIPLANNLYVLGSGNIDTFIAPNPDSIFVDPIRLLTSKKMLILMKYLKKHFDLIIYDTPSVLNYADVSLLAPETDGIVMVAGVGKLETDTLKEAMNQLKYCNTKILGVVKNNLVEKV